MSISSGEVSTVIALKEGLNRTMPSSVVSRRDATVPPAMMLD
jgi:hypothetical protein